jgi:hypothetical protein
LPSFAAIHHDSHDTYMTPKKGGDSFREQRKDFALHHDASKELLWFDRTAL